MDRIVTGSENRGESESEGKLLQTGPDRDAIAGPEYGYRHRRRTVSALTKDTILDQTLIVKLFKFNSL